MGEHRISDRNGKKVKWHFSSSTKFLSSATRTTPTVPIARRLSVGKVAPTVAAAAAAPKRKSPTSSSQVSRIDSFNDDDVFGPPRSDKRVSMSYSEWKKVMMGAFVVP